MNTLVFDIETVPDVDSGRKLYNFEDLSDKEVADAMQTLRRQKTNGSDFVRHHLQRVVSISVLLHNKNKISVWSLGDEQSSEADLITRFFRGLDQYTPTLVSWNGGGFDLPVLHYRALYHGIASSTYWDQGESDPNFRWNNYLSRYHARHLDLMDLLALYQSRANAPLDEIATMLGFPGKMGMSGNKVWPNYLAGNISAIRNYCETDVLNTFLVYCRFELIRGNWSQEEYEQQLQHVRDYLVSQQKPHFDEFLTRWK